MPKAQVIEASEARRRLRHLDFGSTPKDRSWLNPGERKLHEMTRLCLRNRRHEGLGERQEDIAAWAKDGNGRQWSVVDQLTVDNARRKLIP